MLGFALLAVGFGAAFGQSADSVSKLGYKSSGYVYWENYRIGKAEDYRPQIDRGDWFNSILGGFVLENAMSERLKTRVALEARFFRPFPEENAQEASLFTKSDVYLHEAKAVYAYGDPAAPPFEMEVGYFLYDYNRDQHNLGEYLFRSKIYPINLFTDFELPMDRLLGIRVGNNPFNGFHHDLLLTSEYKYYPKSDFSLSYLADYAVAGVFHIGAGVSLAHYLPVRPSLATPKTEQNTYLEIPAQTWTDSNNVTHVIAAPIRFFKNTLTTMPDADSVSYIDPATFSRVIYPQIRQQSTHFSYRGVKVMGRMTFDPKPLFGSPRWLGNEDLKLYGEAALLGLKDYPLLYDDISERIPVMLGFNFPGFKILDVIGLEGEYCGYKFPDNWEKSLRSGVPQPGDVNYTFNAFNHKDDWKWSVYLRKEVSRGLFISAQFASDHLRLADKAGHTYQSVMTDTKSGQWWGIVRVTASY